MKFFWTTEKGFSCELQTGEPRQWKKQFRGKLQNFHDKLFHRRITSTRLMREWHTSCRYVLSCLLADKHTNTETHKHTHPIYILPCLQQEVKIVSSEKLLIKLFLVKYPKMSSPRISRKLVLAKYTRNQWIAKFAKISDREIYENS